MACRTVLTEILFVLGIVNVSFHGDGPHTNNTVIHSSSVVASPVASVVPCRPTRRSLEGADIISWLSRRREEGKSKLTRSATGRGQGQRRFDRVKMSANQDHVCHIRCIAFVFTTVPSDFRLGSRFSGFN